jgi:DNA-binding response OmpR family regulator
VIRGRTLNEALLGVEDPALSAAILDHALNDDDSTQVCSRLKERNIPFVTYSGYDRLGCRGGIHLKKPASMSVLVATVEGLLAARRHCQPFADLLDGREISARALRHRVGLSQMATRRLPQQRCQDQLRSACEPPPLPRQRPVWRRHRFPRTEFCQGAWSSPG